MVNETTPRPDLAGGTRSDTRNGFFVPTNIKLAVFTLHLCASLVYHESCPMVLTQFGSQIKAIDNDRRQDHGD
jgi:hypothetical protein